MRRAVTTNVFYGLHLKRSRVCVYRSPRRECVACSVKVLTTVAPRQRRVKSGQPTCAYVLSPVRTETLATTTQCCKIITNMCAVCLRNEGRACDRRGLIYDDKFQLYGRRKRKKHLLEIQCDHFANASARYSSHQTTRSSNTYYANRYILRLS